MFFKTAELRITELLPQKEFRIFLCPSKYRLSLFLKISGFFCKGRELAGGLFQGSAPVLSKSLRFNGKKHFTIMVLLRIEAPGSQYTKKEQ
ncbi:MULTISPECIES: hypothetical protein [Flavobacterium]|uniref:hypothetical protein n=1 Tax=Flavobacterium TaxID=237 RepID=UPI002113DDD2|nr:MULTISPECIES: hypothetical protein [Flavobacterium]UUF12396.1 hypothetical protein NLJ00_14155 [Flavobacterium panici]